MWTDLATECDGITKAAQNNKADAAKLAAYTYDRCCAFTGADHGGVSKVLIETAMRAYLVERTRQFQELLRGDEPTSETPTFPEKT